MDSKINYIDGRKIMQLCVSSPFPRLESMSFNPSTGTGKSLTKGISGRVIVEWITIALGKTEKLKSKFPFEKSKSKT